jgi:hypothetical protein
MLTPVSVNAGAGVPGGPDRGPGTDDELVGI